MTRTGGPEGPQPAGSAPAKVRVWDPWVRLTHWSLVLLVPALWLTAEKGFLSVHRTLGEVVVGLLLFRIYWGFAGSETARFASFVKGPGAVVAYLKGLGSKTAGHAVGHNAAGGWSILLMLLAIGVQVSLGLVAQDKDGLTVSPLTHLVPYAASEAAREWHERVFFAIVAVVSLHVAAIVYYAFAKRENLVRPMIWGWKLVSGPVAPPAAAPAWRALLGAALAAGLTWWVALGAPGVPAP